MKIAIAMATTGRPDVVSRTLGYLEKQTRAPDKILVVGASEPDLPSLQTGSAVRFALCAKGSSKQRNRAFDLLGADYDVIVFLDDDFLVARDFVAGVETLMRENPDVIAASGHLLADGVGTAGIAAPMADIMLQAYERDGAGPTYLVDQPGAYGCNMIVRASGFRLTRFDEDLPLFGWLEDLDLSARLAANGRVVRTNLCVGVHLAVRNGRSPGKQLGYSQLANPLYLAAKGTMAKNAAVWMATKNVLANSLKSLAPEKYIDRRGRLRGNLLALRDLVLGRLHPTQIIHLH